MGKFQQYTAIIEKEDNLYVALCPELDINYSCILLRLAIANEGQTRIASSDKIILIPDLTF